MSQGLKPEAESLVADWHLVHTADFGNLVQQK